MSRFLPDRLQIGIQPGHLTLVRLSGWRRRTVVAAEHFALPEEAPNTTALAALGQELCSPSWQGTRLHVVVADALARYFISPIPAGARNSGELREAAAMRLEEIFGEEARDWTVAVDLAPFASRHLSCALRAEWLEGIKRIGRKVGLPLASVAPFGVTEFNRHERRISLRSGWFAALGDNTLWLACKVGNGWRSVQVHHANGNVIERLPQLLDRDRLRAGLGDDDGGNRWLCGGVSVAQSQPADQGNAWRRLDFPLWPGQDESWSRTFRLALSPVWPSCA